MKTRCLGLIAVVVLAGSAAAQVESKPVVLVTRPDVRDVERTSTLPGNIEPFEVVQLHAKVTGYVEAILVDIGDRVSEGQELVRLTVPEMILELAQARAEVQAATARLEKARAEAELATTEAKRLTELRARLPGAVAGQDVDVALAHEKVAAADVALATANESLAMTAVVRLEVLMTYASIQAPFDGVVTRRMVHSGALVSAGRESGTPLLEVIRDDVMRLVIHVPEQVAPLVRRGQDLTFQIDALPGRTFRASVARTAVSLSPQSRRMRVEADVERATGCRPGMYATVTLVYDVIADARVVPSRCLRAHEDGSSVLLADAGVLREVPVTVIEDDGAWCIVTGDGLSGESAVVLDPLPDAHSGQQVELRWESETR